MNRVKNSFQILKQCRTGEQRQHFRIVLTAPAPTKVDARDNAGMGRRVTEALDVNRYRATFLDSVDVRAEIDQAATVMNTPLIVGNLVVCRHGTSTLTSCVVGVGVAIRRSSRPNSQIAAI